jgi:hypothetical protein
MPRRRSRTPSCSCPADRSPRCRSTRSDSSRRCRLRLGTSRPRTCLPLGRARRLCRRCHTLPCSYRTRRRRPRRNTRSGKWPRCMGEFRRFARSDRKRAPSWRSRCRGRRPYRNLECRVRRRTAALRRHWAHNTRSDSWSRRTLPSPPRMRGSPGCTTKNLRRCSSHTRARRLHRP